MNILKVNGSAFLQTKKSADFEKYSDFGENLTEADYIKLLQDSQEFFDDFIAGKLKSGEKVFIYAPESYESLSTTKKIYHYIDSNMLAVDAKFFFVDKIVKVKKVGNDFIFCGYDGFKRYEVARRNQLDLLVEIVDEKEYKL